MLNETSSRRTLLGALVFAIVRGRAADPAWRALVTSANEPGEPLIITGRVVRRKDKAPVSGAVVTMYQTDAAGIYGKGQGRPAEISRLRGKLVSGPKGEFEIVTIKPGHYPGGGTPSHIHAAIALPGESERELPEFLFAGDKYISGREKAVILDARRDAKGTWRASHDIVID